MKEVGGVVRLEDSTEVLALFREGLEPSLLCLPRPEDARAVLLRAFRVWFPALLRRGLGAAPVGLAVDLAGWLLGGRGARLAPAASTFGGEEERLELRRRRAHLLARCLEEDEVLGRARRLLGGRRDGLERLDRVVLALLGASPAGLTAGRAAPTVAASERLVTEALRVSPADVQPPRSLLGPLLCPFLRAFEAALEAGEGLVVDPGLRLEVEGGLLARAPLVVPDTELLRECLEAARQGAAAEEPPELPVPARAAAAERAGPDRAVTWGGYTGLRRARGSEEAARVLPSEWALPPEWVLRRLEDREAAVLEVEGREEPRLRIRVSVLLALDPLAADARSVREPRVLALGLLEDLARGLGPAGDGAEGEVLVLDPDQARPEHHRFSLAQGEGEAPFFLGQPGLFPGFFLRRPPGAAQLEACVPRDVPAKLARDLEPRPASLRMPTEAMLHLQGREGRAHSTHAVAILPAGLEHAARFWAEAEEPFGPLDLRPGGMDTLSLVFRRPAGWSLSPLGYPSPGGQRVFPPQRLRREVVEGIRARLSRRPEARRER